jgi:IMP dehydrogenase
MNRIKQGLCFDDVLLEPQYSDIYSRKEVRTDVKLGSMATLKIPIVSSPMDTVTESAMASAMIENGGLGIIHRYNSIEVQSSLVKKALEKCSGIVGVAVGVSGDYIDRACAAHEAGARVICVDIAHGHHILMRNALKTLRRTFGSAIHIMAGNVATLAAFNQLSDWGADSIRVGVGGGSICSTRIQTGHGVPTLQSIMDCSQTDRSAMLIADGGIKNSGDIVKALAAGADMVMLGSMLAGTTETPGEIIYLNGNRCKAYRGMASKDAQIQWRGHTASIEGVSSTVPLKGDVKSVVSEIMTGVRSGMSYTGVRTLRELHLKSNFIRQTSAGSVESSTHINRV